MSNSPIARTSLLTLILLVFSLGVFAQNKVVVVPLFDDGGFIDHIWLPAANAVIRFVDSTKAHTEIDFYGKTCVEQDISGSLLVDVFLPIQMDVPRGRNAQIVSVHVYYEVRENTAFINKTELHGRNFDTGAAIRLARDLTQRTATSFSTYSVDVTPYDTTTIAPTNLRLELRMTAVGTFVCLYGARLQIG